MASSGDGNLASLIEPVPMRIDQVHMHARKIRNALLFWNRLVHNFDSC